MNSIDIIIVLFAISSLIRGYRIGLIRQAGSTIGFVAGLFLGSFIGNIIISHETGSLNKSLTSLLVVLLTSFIFMSVGEVLGIKLKNRVVGLRSVDAIDGGLGSVMAVLTLLFAVWLGAAILVLGPPGSFQQTLRRSRIIASLDSHLPPATQFLSTLNKLIDPNGFPQVFQGLEPHPGATSVPSLGSLNAAVQQTQASVVKVEGTGCGGIVEGSGWVYGPDRIVTNAHVVAGVADPKVIDAHGIHNTRVVWFDPNVDIAVLQVSNLAGKPLSLNSIDQSANTPGVVEGYPGGGDFDAEPAAVIDHFAAYGRNIYGQGTTVRDIYSIQARVIPGNSGGPLVSASGQVLGIVFATSTTYNDVGYVLTGHQVAGELATAAQANQTVGTGSCSE